MESIGLAEAFASAGPRPKSQVDRILTDLLPPDAEAFKKALQGRSLTHADEFQFSASSVAKIMTDAGYPLSADSVIRYRRTLKP